MDGCEGCGKVMESFVLGFGFGFEGSIMCVGLRNLDGWFMFIAVVDGWKDGWMDGLYVYVYVYVYVYLFRKYLQI